MQEPDEGRAGRSHRQHVRQRQRATRARGGVTQTAARRQTAVRTTSRAVADRRAGRHRHRAAAPPARTATARAPRRHAARSNLERLPVPGRGRRRADRRSVRDGRGEGRRRRPRGERRRSRRIRGMASAARRASARCARSTRRRSTVDGAPMPGAYRVRFTFSR